MKKIFILFSLLSLQLTLALRPSNCPKACTLCVGPFRDLCAECAPGTYLDNGVCLPCHNTCQFCNGPLTSDCLPENLHTILHTHRLLSNGDISVPSDKIEFHPGFTLNFEFKNDSSIDLLLNFSVASGFFAIGFGKGMYNSDMIICELAQSEIVCGDYWSTSGMRPKLDTALGGTNDIVQLGYSIEGTTNIVKLNRKLNTGDQYDHVIVNGTNPMIWAFSDSEKNLSMHSDYASVNAQLVSGGAAIQTDYLAIIHALANYVMWGMLVDIGLIFLLLLKSWRHHIMMHAIIMWIIVITSTVLNVWILVRNGITRDVVYFRHFVVGVTILGLMWLQHILGNTLYIISNRKTPTNAFYRIRLVHRCIGLTIYILGKVNIILGSRMYNNGVWEGWMDPTIFIFKVLIVVSKLWQRFRPKKFHPLVAAPASKLQLHQDLLKDIKHGKSREELLTKYPTTKFVYLYNRVYDLTRFTHPGGNFMINSVIGREIGRFVHGAYHIEDIHTRINQHRSSDIAILNKYFIGEVSQGKKSILVNNAGKHLVTNDFVSWRYEGKTELTTSTARFEFKNIGYRVCNVLPGISWVGRHFYITKDLVHGPTRPYTVCVSLGSSWTAFRDLMIDFFNFKMGQSQTPSIADSEQMKIQLNQSKESTFVCELEPYQDSLPLVIKYYHNPKVQGVSEYLHFLPEESSESVLISGPVGRGIEIDDDSSGLHYVFTVGTGILPFIDLLNFILFKCMYLALKDRHGESIANQINPLSQDYEGVLSNDFQLVLIAAYKNDDDAIGFNIIRKTAEISARYGLNIFMAYVSGAEGDYVEPIEGRIDKKFIKKNVKKGAAKYLVCGNPEFNKDVPSFLKEMGINPLKIVLV